MDRALFNKLFKTAHDNPTLRPQLLPLIQAAQAEMAEKQASEKVARPVALRNADVMLYMIDPRKNTSKFYEMAVVRAGNETPAKKEKRHSTMGSNYVLMRRWGRLTDSGTTGRVDSSNDFFYSEREAQAAMHDMAYAKERKGYEDVTRKGEYPIDLGSAGFGWGGQAACQIIPELNDLLSMLADAEAKVNHALSSYIRPVAKQDSSMAQRLQGELGQIVEMLQSTERFLNEQLSHCR